MNYDKYITTVADGYGDDEFAIRIEVVGSDVFLEQGEDVVMITPEQIEQLVTILDVLSTGI
jgi:hypothetical protein